MISHAGHSLHGKSIECRRNRQEYLQLAVAVFALHQISLSFWCLSFFDFIGTKMRLQKQEKAEHVSVLLALPLSHTHTHTQIDDYILVVTCNTIWNLCWFSDPY